MFCPVRRLGEQEVGLEEGKAITEVRQFHVWRSVYERVKHSRNDLLPHNTYPRFCPLEYALCPRRCPTLAADQNYKSVLFFFESRGA